MWGPKNEAEAAPPPSEGRDLFLCIWFPFTFTKGVGDFQQGCQRVPLEAAGQPARLVPIPERASWDPMISYIGSPFFCLLGQEHIVSASP